ncbi:MAG: hypothetical protein LBD75_08245 [Candidatus Peribacteria bacterium]|jgi:hypothetical protein|nr:hypothetical protein [Candidatus Peribacteria bacterium]
MEKHTLILLGGNNSTSKAWIQKMNQHLQLDYPTVEFFYSHWEGDSHDIDFKHEIKKLSQFIKDNKLGNYSIVAKSAGFVLSLQGIIDNLLTPKTIV